LARLRGASNWIAPYSFMDSTHRFAECSGWLLRTFRAGAYSLRTTYGLVPALKQNVGGAQAALPFDTFCCAAVAQSLPTHTADHDRFGIFRGEQVRSLNPPPADRRRISPGRKETKHATTPCCRRVRSRGGGADDGLLSLATLLPSGALLHALL